MLEFPVRPVFFEAGSHYVVQDGLDLMVILLPQLPKYWGLQAGTTMPSYVIDILCVRALL